MKEQGATGTWSKGISGRQSYSAYSQGGFGSFAGSISQRTVVPYETQNNRMVNIKQFLYRPGQAGPESSRTLRQAREGGKVVSPTQRPPLTAASNAPRQTFLVLTSVKSWVHPRTIVRPEGLCQWKIPMTPSGIEPATYAPTNCATLLQE